MKKLSDLPWRCTNEIRDFIVLEALVSPPNPIAFALMTKETVVAGFRECWQDKNGFDEESLWSGFKEFAESDWSPTKIFEWLEALGEQSRPQFDPGDKLERPR